MTLNVKPSCVQLSNLILRSLTAQKSFLQPYFILFLVRDILMKLMFFVNLCVDHESASASVSATHVCYTGQPTFFVL